jgi:hypothetical protein
MHCWLQTVSQHVPHHGWLIQLGMLVHVICCALGCAELAGKVKKRTATNGVSSRPKRKNLSISKPPFVVEQYTGYNYHDIALVAMRPCPNWQAFANTDSPAVAGLLDSVGSASSAPIAGSTQMSNQTLISCRRIAKPIEAGPRARIIKWMSWYRAAALA